MSGEGTPAITGTGSIAGLHTLSELRALVYAPLRDSEHAFFDTWLVDSLLNEAYLDLNARLRLTQTNATGTCSSTGTIPYPADTVEVINLWIDGIAVQFVHNEIYKSWNEPGTSTPYITIARVFDQVIETYPSQDDADYELEYVSRPDTMVADSDQPTSLGPELQPRLVQYARAHLKWQDGQEAEGSRYMAMYEEGLPGAPRMQYNLRPAPTTMLVEPGPFE